MKKAILTLVLLCTFSSVVSSATDSDSSRYRPGLRNSTGRHQLSEVQLRRLLERLRARSGFLEMQFDDSGFLTLGSRTCFEGGSATARWLLAAAVDGELAFDLEAYDHSPEVSFASISPIRTVVDHVTTERIPVREMQLDFGDFEELRGSPEVLAAFDLGFGVMHELAHGVMGLRDAYPNTRELGACETVINHVRRELNLPERRSYFARVRPTWSFKGTTMQGELVFVREGDRARNSKSQTFYLTWDAGRVEKRR